MLPRVPCRYLNLKGSFYIDQLLVDREDLANEIAGKFKVEIEAVNKTNPIKKISLTQMKELALAFRTNRDKHFMK